MCVRRTRLFGTHGQLECLDGKRIVLQNFADKAEQEIAFDKAPSGQRLQGHGGADFFLAQSFVRAILHNDRSLLLSGGADTLESHTVVFAAEQARRQSSVVNLATFA